MPQPDATPAKKPLFKILGFLILGALVVFVVTKPKSSAESETSETGSVSNKEQIVQILKANLPLGFPMEDVVTADIEGGTGVIIADSWCYWIDASGNLFCVNGASKTLLREAGGTPIDAPIKAMYGDIKRVAR